MTMQFLPNGITINAMGGRCYTCGDQHRKGQTAFAAAAFEDFLGRVEICNRCITKAADKLGLMPVKQHEAVRATNQRQMKERETLLREIELLREGRTVDAALHAEEVARLKVQIEKAKAGAR